METRRLGRNGPDLTVIGFGAWAIGGGGYEWGWGPQDDSASVAAIHRALDLGINWIDTAAVYGLGHSEEVVGKAVQGRRDRVCIATKCGQVWDERGRIRTDDRARTVRREVEASLRRLKIDVIDLYQVHWPDPETPAEETWEAMAALQDEGKVRFLGVSNFDVPLMERCRAIRHIDSLQPPYSMLMRDVEDEILPYCAKHGIGVVVYSPLQSGLLTGRFDPARLAPDDWRRRDEAFRPPLLAKNLAFVERLRGIASRHGKTPGPLAIAWVLRHPAVTGAIVGARRRDQVDENVGAAGWQLAPSELEEIERGRQETGARAA